MKPYYQEPISTLYCGHALDLKELPAESVDMCICSPPYWGLRSYKTEPQIWDSKDGCVHEWVTETFKQHAGRGDCQSSRKYSEQDTVPDMKLDRRFCSLCGAWRGELGLEPTIELYIKHLILIFNEVKRVLKKTGTCWVNIDDSYASQPSGSRKPGDLSYFENEAEGEHGRINKTNVGVPPKSLCLIPSRFALAMVENGWRCRQDIAWNKPNPMPESVKDRFTGSWEHLFFFVKSKRYFFEQQFEPAFDWGTRDRSNLRDGTQDPLLKHHGLENCNWEICTVPSPKHKGIRNFATFPEKLCETPILAGCPSMICKKCGKAREKIYQTEPMKIRRTDWGEQAGNRTASSGTMLEPNKSEFLGYTDCGCNAGFEPGVVLDQFCGSGTTLVVAKKLGRKSIGIDISPNYCKLTVKRLQEIPIPMELV